MSETLEFSPRDEARPAGRTGSPEGPPILEAIGLHKSFKVGGGGRLEVLRGVDLRVRRGEIVAIMGESGAGKSTLLHLLGLLDTPTDGEVRFHGQNAAYLSDRDKARIRNREIGFVFQLYFLVPELTALENVFTPSLIRHSMAAWWKRRDEARRRAHELLKVVGLEERARHRPYQLSGGESQRVALARALMHHPGVVLCDEPTGNLDPATKGGVHELILDLNRREGQAFVIVTHDQNLAGLAHRVLEIRKDGRLHPATGEADPADNRE